MLPRNVPRTLQYHFSPRQTFIRAVIQITLLHGNGIGIENGEKKHYLHIAITTHLSAIIA